MHKTVVAGAGAPVAGAVHRDYRMRRVARVEAVALGRWRLTLGCGHGKVALEPWAIGTLTQCFHCGRP